MVDFSKKVAGARITHEPDPFIDQPLENENLPEFRKVGKEERPEKERTVYPAGMEERKEAMLLRFEKPGDKVEGHIAGFLRTQIDGKPAVSIFLAMNERTDQFVKIHATRQLLEKIRTTDSGRKVRITYQGENDQVKTVGNRMRIFTVLIDTRAEPRMDLLMDTSLLEMLQDEG